MTSICVDLLNIKEAGILLADATGHLRIGGASSEQIRLLELFQLQNEQGPCLDCYTTGETVAAPNLTAPTPWPKFATASVNDGYRWVYALPLHHNRVTLGCLNLFKADAEPLAPSDIALAQGFADVARIAIMQSHANQQTDDRNGRLNHALGSRITVEQAKGMVVEHFAVDVHDAFEMLRSYGFASNRSLLEVATSVRGRHRLVRIGGELDLATRDACFNACVVAGGESVDVDISAITFMDGSGYGALIAARRALEQQGRSLSVSHAANQPAYLRRLLAEYEYAAPTQPSSHTNDGTSVI